MKGSFPADSVTLRRLPDFYFHNSQPDANCFNVPEEEGGVDSGREGGAGLQICLATFFLPLTHFWPRDKKKKTETHPLPPLPLQTIIELESGEWKVTPRFVPGWGFRACNYVCLATMQVLCNIMAEEHSSVLVFGSWV